MPFVEQYFLVGVITGGILVWLILQQTRGQLILSRPFELLAHLFMSAGILGLILGFASGVFVESTMPRILPLSTLLLTLHPDLIGNESIPQWFFLGGLTVGASLTLYVGPLRYLVVWIIGALIGAFPGFVHGADYDLDGVVFPGSTSNVMLLP